MIPVDQRKYSGSDLAEFSGIYLSGPGKWRPDLKPKTAGYQPQRDFIRCNRSCWGTVPVYMPRQIGSTVLEPVYP